MAIIYGILDTIRIIEKSPYPVSKRSPKQRGKKGEIKTLNQLSELDNNYHIFCGMKIKLRVWAAQIDFVVVSKRGVVSIEVKNWTDEYLAKEQAYRKKYGGDSPHSQADNSGRILWTALKTSNTLNAPPVRKVLLSTYGNMRYDPQYEFVNVKNLESINSFIQTRNEVLSEEQVRKVVEYLMQYIPNCMTNYGLR